MTWKKDILYAGTKEVAEVDSANKTWTTFVDHLGSPRFTWDGVAPTGGKPDGVHLIEQKFLPFGESLTNPADASMFAKGFTNHEQTDASGLIYMQARFYAPWFGRFLSPDPARDQHFEETQSWNIYSYCQNDPTMKTDPTGMIAGGVIDWGGLWNKIKSAFSSGPSKSAGNGQTSPGIPEAKAKAKNAPEVFDGLSRVKAHLGSDYKFTPTCGVRTPEENAKVHGSPTSDHVVGKKEEGEKGAIDGHWTRDGQRADKEVHDKLSNDGFYIGEGYQEIYHPTNTNTKGEHWHLGWNSDREGTEYKHEVPGSKKKSSYPVDKSVSKPQDEKKKEGS